MSCSATFASRGRIAIHSADLAAIALLTPAAAALLAVLIGWGRLARRLMPDSGDGAGPWTVAAWTGWAAGTVFLQVWHFALPIDWRTAAVVGLVGMAGWWRRKSPAAPADRLRAYATGAVCLALFALIVRHARSDLPVYDAGMYYYQAIRWLNEHPIVPGLGNLNMQLGINQTYFLWAALLNLHPVWRGGFMVVNGLALVLAMVPGLQELVRLRRRDLPPDTLAILRILSVPILTAFAMNEGTANPAPDVFAWILCLVVFERAAVWLLSARPAPAAPPRPPFILLLLGVILVTVKLSMLVYSAMLLAVVAAVYVARTRTSLPRRTLLRHVAAAAAIVLAGGLPWVVRNVVTTGYPLFPSPVVACPVEWRIPDYKVRGIAGFIGGWARHPGGDEKSKEFRRRLVSEEQRRYAAEPDAMSPEAFRDLSRGTPWFAGWMKNSLRSPLMAVCLGGPVVLGLALLFLRGWNRSAGASAGFLDPLYVPLLAATAFWFYAAPAPRFGLPFLLLLLLLPGTQICAGLPLGPAALRPGIAGLSVLLAALSFVPGFPPRSKLWNTTVLPPRPMGDMRPRTTRSGLVVNAPVRDVRCYDSPLPSTHIWNPHLSLLDPDRGIAGGFRDDTPSPSPGL